MVLWDSRCGWVVCNIFYDDCGIDNGCYVGVDGNKDGFIVVNVN